MLTYPARLKSQLASAGIVPGNVPALAEICEEWFVHEPTLPVFVLRSIFWELASEWSDPQGIPTALYQPFEQKLLPELTAAAEALATNPPAPADLARLIEAFRDSRAAATRAAQSAGPPDPSVQSGPP